MGNHEHPVSYSLPILIFFSVLGGIALGLFISNELAARRIKKSVQLQEKQVMQKIPEWLQRIADQDLANLAQRIKVDVRQLRFEGLKNLQPEFDMILSLTNTSVFKVNLESCIGVMQFASSKWEPRLDNPTSLVHGENKRIHLRQPITSEASRWLIEQASTNNPVNFVCIECRLVFKIANEGYETKKVEIPVREDGLTCIPKNSVTVELPHSE